MSDSLVAAPPVPPPFVRKPGRKRGLPSAAGRLSRTEVFAIFLALLMSGGPLGIFLSGISIWRLVLGVEEDGQGMLVGRLSREEGKVRRQRARSTEFLQLQSGAELFNHDFIITGASGSASIALEDGGVIELGPSTLIRLSFDSSFSLGGVVRGTRVDLVEGELSGQAGSGQLKVKSKEGTTALSGSARSRVKAAVAPLVIPKIAVPAAKLPSLATGLSTPSSSVASSALEVVRSSLGRTSEINASIEKGKPVARTEVTFETRGVPSEELRRKPPVLEIGSESEASSKPPRILPLKWAREGLLSGELAFTRPGTYSWRLRPAPDAQYELKALAGGGAVEGNVTAKARIVGLRILAPRIGGQELRDNQFTGGEVLKGKGDGLEIRWNVIQPTSLKQVEVAVFDGTSAAAKQEGEVAAAPLATATASGTTTVIKNPRILGRPVRIELRSQLESGFELVSEPYSYEFRLQPPALSTPKPNAQVSLASLSARADGALLLTWKRTHFTDEYRVQIAADPSFQRLILDQSVEENFYVWSEPKAGSYWWRVGGRVAGKASGFSAPNALTLKP